MTLDNSERIDDRAAARQAYRESRREALLWDALNELECAHADLEDVRAENERLRASLDALRTANALNASDPRSEERGSDGA